MSLQEYAAAKENEIRDVCSENHQEFVDSIEEIVRMKGDVARLQVMPDEQRFEALKSQLTDGWTCSETSTGTSAS